MHRVTATLAMLAAFAGLAAGSSSALGATLGFATLQVGAINNLQAQVIGKVVQEHTGLQIRVTPMRGGAAILTAVSTRRAEFGITEINDMADAVTGSHEFKGRPQPNLRIVFKVVSFPIGIMVRNDSDIHSLADLKGRRFPTGWQAFPNGVPLSNGVLAAAGLSLDDVDPVPASGLIPAANDFKAGKNDATAFAVGAPKVAEINAAVGGVRFLSMDDSPEALARVKAVRPDYFIMRLEPSPRYPGIVAPTNVLGVDLLIVAGTHVSDDVVYRFVKAVAENKPELVAGHPSFNGFFPDQRMAKQFRPVVQYHPGAIKYYREKGIWTGR